jgi:hypothetical protein
MSNNSKKRPSRQINRRHQIEAAKITWQEEADRLDSAKATLNYKDAPWAEFLAIIPNDNVGTITCSEIIALQDQYKIHQKNKELIWSEDNAIDELNKLHAIVHPGQTYVLTEEENASGYKDFALESKASLKDFYEDEIITCIDGVERSKADVWLKSSKRRKYRRIIFDPSFPGHINGHYNLWKGFTKIPMQGSAELYWNHTKENICSDNDESYQYVRKWLAYIFQRPKELHTGLVLCGSQGVGKNSFVEPLGVLLGLHYTPLSSLHELTSNFNNHLKNAILIHANEALWGGHKKEIGIIKAMITDRRCLIESKGKDRVEFDNVKHVILSSNEDWPLHLDPDNRRFFVFNVSDKHKEDHQYFKAIQYELDNGGYEALLYDLLHEDITDFNPRRLPSTSNAFDIQMRSADSAYRYLYEALCEGGFSIGRSDDDVSHEGRGTTESPVWQGPIPKDTVYADYVLWCQKDGEHTLSKEQFGRVIKKTIVSVKDIRPGGGRRLRCYEFPSLRKSREEFCKAFKEKIERIFEEQS